MRASRLRPILLATAFALAGCEGDGTNEAWRTAIQPPPPPPPPPIVPAGTTSQQFTVMGASHANPGDQAPLFGPADQLQVRYVQSSNSYEVELPHSQTWGEIHIAGARGEDVPHFFDGTATVSTGTTNTQYSSLLSWRDPAGTYAGIEAIGIATPSGAVPTTGTAIFNGSLSGSTSEVYLDKPVTMFGGIQLTFDFGAGTLAGKLTSLSVFSVATYDDWTILFPYSFRDTVYSSGSTTFSGKFDTNLPGLNFFSGRFDGPHAEELIGNFALPFQSPIDDLNYQADGAFVGKK